MKNKAIRNILLLLIIPIIITIIISVSVNKKNNQFNATVVNNYNNKAAITEVQTTNSEISDGKNFFSIIGEDYTYVMFTAIALVIIFTLFYFYLTRKKEW